MSVVDVIKFGAEEAESASGIAALGFDFKAFIIQLITFLLVFYVLKRFVFGRIVDLLEKRRLTIEAGLKLTNEMKAEKEKLEREITRIRHEARQDADKIITASHQQAEAMIKDAQDNAQNKVDNMLADAKKKIGDETERARRTLERETVELVIMATEAVVREKLDPKKDAKLVAASLKGSR